MNAFVSLANSRKFWVGTFSVLGIAAGTFLRSTDKIPSDALLPFILGVGGLGSAFMIAVGMEDAAKKLIPPRAADTEGADDTHDTDEEPVEPARKKGSIEDLLTAWIAAQDLPHYVDLVLRTNAESDPIETIEWRRGEEALGSVLDDVLLVARRTFSKNADVTFVLTLQPFEQGRKKPSLTQAFALDDSETGGKLLPKAPATSA